MIHKFYLNGCYLVLDVNSGAVHLVDKLLYDLLDYLEPAFSQQQFEEAVAALSGMYTREELEDGRQDILELYEMGQLFSQDDYQPLLEQMTSSPVKALCLHVAHDCNLRCQYCFASTGDFGGGRLLMPLEVGKKALDFLVANSGSRHNLEVDFFGGEPLMNFEVVKALVAYGRELEKIHNKTFRFTITTNGVLLDEEKMAFINQEMSNVVLSIDGRKEVNDRMRPCINGSGSYDVILPKFRRMVELREHRQYYVRGTFTKYNLDFSKDVEHLNRVGFDQISVEPVVSDPQYPYALTEEDLPAIFQEYERLANRILEERRKGNWYNFFHFMIDLDQGPCAIKRLRGCGSGNEYVAITPDGDIYPCHQFVGNEAWKMGNVMDGSFNREMKNSFACTNIYTKEDCKDCWAKFYCSGGCSANSVNFTGDIRKSHRLSCEMEKKRVECAIMIRAVESEEAAHEPAAIG